MRVNLKNRLAAILKTKFETSPLWAARALVRVFTFQTAAEQESEATFIQNGVGFNSNDAEFGTSLATKAKDWFDTPKAERRFTTPFGPRLAPYAVKLAKKYAGQVAQYMLAENRDGALKLFEEAGDTAAIAALVPKTRTEDEAFDPELDLLNWEVAANS